MIKNKIITICASASFYGHVIEIQTQLKKLGFKVLIPLTAQKMQKNNDFRVEKYKTWIKKPEDYKKKTVLTRRHFIEIAKGDVILVLNYQKNGKSGYIGGAVLSEMAVAFYLKKSIYILNKIDNNSIFKEEIYGFQPTILNGNLNLIKK